MELVREMTSRTAALALAGARRLAVGVATRRMVYATTDEGKWASR
jgi:hypothetical protein